MKLYQLINLLKVSVKIFVTITDHSSKPHFSGTVQDLVFNSGTWFFSPFSDSKVTRISIEDDIFCIYCEEN